MEINDIRSSPVMRNELADLKHLMSESDAVKFLLPFTVNKDEYNKDYHYH